MAHDSALSRLLLGLYGCVLDADRWHEFLRELSTQLDMPRAAFTHHGIATAGLGFASAAYDVDPSALAEYGSYFGARDPWAAAVRAHGGFRPGRVQVAIGERLVTPAAFRRTEYYADFARRYDYVQCAVAVTVPADGTSTTSLTFPLGSRERVPDASQLVLLDLVARHLQQALDIQRKLNIEREHTQWMAFAAGQVDPLFLLDTAGRVRYANDAAEDVVARRPELRLLAGRLVAATRPLQRSLDATISAALSILQGHREAPPLPCRLTPLGHDRPLLVEACPMPAWTMTPGVAVVVTEAPAARIVDAKELVRLLSLTAAEARISAALASGASVADVARCTKANPATIRWHLKRIYSKTGTGSQAQLVALVLRLGASRPTAAERHRRASRAKPRGVGT